MNVSILLKTRTVSTLYASAVTRKRSIKLVVVGGLLIVLGALLFETEFFGTVFISFVTVLALVPMAYSYIKFKNLEKKG